MVLQYVATHAHDHCRVLRQRFDALDVAPPDTPSLRLSKVAAGLTRQEAARLFYQICSTLLPPMYLVSALHAKEPSTHNMCEAEADHDYPRKDAGSGTRLYFMLWTG